MENTEMNFSIFVSKVMDVLGYSYEMIRQRRKMPDFMPDDCILAGSTGEGSTSLFESDIDCMAVLDDSLCTDNVSKHVNNLDTTIFELNLRDASPGYTRLRLEQLTGLTDYEDFCIEVDGNFYLQSANLLRYVHADLSEISSEFVEGDGVNILPVSGPSFPGTLYGIAFDYVVAIKCECSEILQDFLSRPRKFNWPSIESLNTISNQNSYVVPVGNMSGDRPDIEWRICYTEAEILLMGKLNETQIQLYILLKLLAKSALKDISSYILKNLVLWMSELFPSKLFTKELLLKRLVHALKILRLCVKNSYLPNYMIPRRNMLNRKLMRQEQIKVLKQLTYMIDEGEQVVFLCPKIKEAMIVMYQSPEKAVRFGTFRDTIEQWVIAVYTNDEEEDEVTEVLRRLGCEDQVDDDGINGKLVHILKQLFA